jgi:uncharacterized membrane protein YqaE (UPF0057 family)
MLHLYSIYLSHAPSLFHLSQSCSIFIPFISVMLRLYSIYLSHAPSLFHLSQSCSIFIPFISVMLHLYSIYLSHAPSVFHLSQSCSVFIPFISVFLDFSVSDFSKNTTIFDFRILNFSCQFLQYFSTGHEALSKP